MRSSIVPLVRSLLLAAGVAGVLLVHPGTADAAPPTVAGDAPMISPRDIFTDLPAIEFGMSFADAKKAIQKTGASPVDSTRQGGELVWDGKFAGTDGRATTLYKPDAGLWEIAVVVYAMDQRKAIFDRWNKTVTDRHGPATGTEENEDTVSRVWRFKTGRVLALSLSKDANSPVVDIRWVKE